MRSVSTLILPLAAVACMSLSSGCEKKNQATEPSKTDNSNQTPTPTPAPEKPKPNPNVPKPDFTLTSVELVKAYAADFKAADQKYDKKTLRVKGKIIGLDKMELEVHLEGSGQQMVVGRVGLGYDDIAKAKKVGDEITIQGTLDSVRPTHISIIHAVWVAD